MEILYSWHRVMNDKNARLFFVGSISDGQDEYLAKIQSPYIIQTLNLVLPVLGVHLY